MQRHYIQADALFFICYCCRFKFILRYRSEDINILRSRYSILFDTTLGAWQVHDMSMHLIFTALTYKLLFKKETCFKSISNPK